MKRQATVISCLPVIASLVVLAICLCAVIGYGAWYQTRIDERMSGLRVRIKAIQSARLEAKARQQWLLAHQGELSRLSSYGWMRPESRTLWLQRLDHWQVQHPYARLEYHLSPRLPVSEGGLGGWQPVFTRMSVSLLIVQEGEWFDFLDAIRGTEGTAKVHQCQLQRHAAEERTASEQDVPILALHCELDWFGVERLPAKTGTQEVLP